MAGESHELQSWECQGFTPRVDIRKLLGYEGQYRLRVGDYRVLFGLLKPRTIKVYAILRRRKAYQKR